MPSKGKSSPEPLEIKTVFDADDITYAYDQGVAAGRKQSAHTIMFMIACILGMIFFMTLAHIKPANAGYASPVEVDGNTESFCVRQADLEAEWAKAKANAAKWGTVMPHFIICDPFKPELNTPPPHVKPDFIR